MDALIFLKECNKESTIWATSLKVDKMDMADRTLISYYASMIEFSTSIYILAEAKVFTGIPSLFRVALECYVDLKNLIKNQNYINNLELSYLYQWQKVTNAAKGGNPYLADIAQTENINKEIAQTSAKIQELEKDHYKDLNIFERFSLAGMEEEYHSLYNFWCCETHNNIRALIDRHVEINDKNNDFSLVINKVNKASEFDHYFGTYAHWLLQSSQAINSHFKGDNESQISLKLSALYIIRDEMLINLGLEI